jgi:hypothetical protein
MRRALGGLLLLLAACGPNPPPPVRVMAIVPGITGAYEPKEVELKTITSITLMEGTIGKLYGGSEIMIDPQDPLLQAGNLDDAELEAALLKNLGGDVSASYIEKDGVQYPADFHTWNMVSTYWNFEKSFEYFQQTYDGASTEKLLNARILYWVDYQDKQSRPGDPPVLDNALYFSPVRAFVIVPFKDLQKVPLAMNLGVIGHEYAHRVFNLKAYGGKSIPDAINSWQLAPFNILKALDEGLADFHGYAVTCAGGTGISCRPNFLGVSVDEAATTARDISRTDKCITQTLRDAMNNFTQSQWLNQGLQYQLGTIMASSLYHAVAKTNATKLGIMSKAVVASYDDPSPTSEGFFQIINRNLGTANNFTLELVANTLLSHITDPELQRATCSELLDRLQLDRAMMPACPISAVKGTTCPVLP